MKKKLKIGFLFILVQLISILKLLSQDDKGSPTFYNIYLDNVKVKFSTYEGYKIQANLKEFKEKDLQTPESLMHSHESCNSEEWMKKIDKDFRSFSKGQIVSGSLDSNYRILLNNIYITKNGTEYCIVKYYVRRLKGWPGNYHFPACLCLQKVNGQWKIVFGNGFLEPYYNLMYSLDSKYLQEIFITQQSSDSTLNSMIKNSNDGGIINIGKLYYNYMKLFEGDYEKNSTIQKISEQGIYPVKNINIKRIIEHEVNTRTICKVNMYQKYFLDKPKEIEILYKGKYETYSNINKALLNLINQSSTDNPIGTKFKNIPPNDTSVNIRVQNKIELKYTGKEYVIVKYKYAKYNSISFGSIVMEVKNNDYQYTSIPDELKVVSEVFSRLKPKMVSYIENENYEEYVNIRKNSIDESKTLNLTLLNDALNKLQKETPALYNKLAQ